MVFHNLPDLLRYFIQHLNKLVEFCRSIYKNVVHQRLWLPYAFKMTSSEMCKTLPLAKKLWISQTVLSITHQHRKAILVGDMKE